MPTRITATKLAKNLSDALNRTRYRGETFLIERNGEAVAILAPIAEAPAFRLKDLLDVLRDHSLDDDFANHLEQAHDLQGKVPTATEWPS